jgi:hypothetical protein
MRNEEIGSTNGTAVIAPEEPVVAGDWGTWTITYTAGPEGIAVGGSVRFEIPYGFTPPQFKWPGDVGHVSARCSRRAARLQLSLDPPVTLDPEPFYYVTRWGRMIYAQVLEAPLVEGDEIVLEYGRLLHSPTPGGARAQHFAQTVEFTVATDAEGTRSAKFSGYTLVAEPPRLRVVGGLARRRRFIMPSVVAAREPFTVRVLSLDEHGNTCKPVSSWQDEFAVAGEHRFEEREAVLTGGSNPVLCLPREPVLKLYWGDIHGHTILSDGLGSPEDYLAFGREEALLDFCAIADHAQYMSDEDWALTQQVTRQFNAPGEYVTLLGYEYSCNARLEHYGDKCLYYPGDEGPLLRETDINRGPYHDMAQFAPVWKEHGAMMVLHQHARGTCSYYDPELVRLAEVYSIWGCSEDAGGTRPLLPARNHDYTGHTVADALEKGWLLGLVASSDDHAGRPGATDWLRVSRAYPGGLVAVWARELTREAIWEALWNRRCYGTTGGRIILEFEVDDEPMGSVISSTAFRGGHQLRARVLGEAPLQSVEVLRGREVIHTECSFNCSLRLEVHDDPPAGAAHYYTLRVTQADGEMAWSSPVWVV